MKNDILKIWILTVNCILQVFVEKEVFAKTLLQDPPATVTRQNKVESVTKMSTNPILATKNRT